MIIELKNDSASAEVNTMGAELISFQRKDGFELLWQGDSKYWSGQAPVLFPIVGPLRDGKAKINGNWSELTRHGFARRMEFQIVAQTGDSVELRLSANEVSRKAYPYDFSFTVGYTLCEKGLITQFTVENTGVQKLPFCVGGHPAYNIPQGEGECFEDYVIEFSEKENQRCPEIDPKVSLIDFSKCIKELHGENIIPLQHSLFYRDALVFENLNSTKVALKSLKSGHGVEMDFTGFCMFGIWSATNDAPFVALEPWSGCATTTEEGDIFEEKRHMTFLPVGGQKKFAFTTRYY